MTPSETLYPREVLDQVLKLIGTSRQSAAEIRAFLESFECNEAIIDKTFERLAELNIYPDRDLAKLLLTQFEDYGDHIIIEKMADRGISQEIAWQALKEAPAEVERAAMVADAIRPSITGETEAECQEKLAALLAKRGF